MGLFDIFKKKNLKKDKGINTFFINDVKFVIKEDSLFKSFGKFKADTYGVIEDINIKITMPKYMFSDNLVDVKPEYITRISNITKHFKDKYDLIVDRIALETANYLNSKQVRKEQYTKDEVLQNIKTNSITFALGNDSLFGCWLDDESVLYSEYEDGTYKVEFFNEED